MANISDREAFLALVNALATARESARALGHLRSDERWIVVSRIFDRTKDRVEELFTKSSRQGSPPVIGPSGSPIILPPGYR